MGVVGVNLGEGNFAVFRGFDLVTPRRDELGPCIASGTVVFCNENALFQYDGGPTS